MAAKPKTVFERLEERMERIEQIIDKIIPAILDKIIPAIDNVKTELPGSIGPNLMSFADMIGEQIENVTKAVSSIPSGGGGEGTNIDTSGLITPINKILENFNTLIENINQLNMKMDNITNEINSLKGAITQVKVAPAPAAPVQQTTTTVQKIKSQVKPASTPATYQTPQTQTKPAPAVIQKPAQPVSSSDQIPVVTTEFTTVPPEVFNLLDSITEKLKSGTLALQMAEYMEGIRDKVVELYKWHPILYEVATQARKLKKSGPEDPIDADTYQLLLEKVQEWKQRIKSG
ncbi:MAG: hypothetical protein ACTSPY_03055 [Candidatus Helarchaeota archaeon]